MRQLPQINGLHQSERPHNRERVYQGWKVVAALFVVGMMVYGCGLYSFTLFITPLTEEFGWSRAATSGLVSVYWLAAPLTLFGEPLVRRLGGVRLICAGIILAALATFSLGFCNTLPFLFTLRFLSGVGKVMMASGVTLLAGQWFRKRFGLALACCYAGWHFGGLLMVPITQFLIDTVGWRETTTIMSVAIVAIALPAVLIWARWPSPLQRGVEPETNIPLRPDEQNAHRISAPLPRVLKHPVLWLSIGVTVLGGFAYGALLTNEAALIDEIPPLHGWGAIAVSATAFAALCGAIGMGWLADKLTFLRAIMLELAVFLLGVLGFLGLYIAPYGSLSLIAAIIFGIAVGGFEAAILAHMRRTLQADEFDHAFGIWYFCYLAILFVGPIGVGWVHDVSHSYAPALVILVVLTAAAFIPAGFLAVIGSRSLRIVTK